MNTMTLWNISPWGFAALALATLLVGFSKTAVSGANTVSLAVFAAVLPPRASTGILLPLLISGDVLAVLTYRRHAHWPTLWRLFPAVAAGVIAGTVFLVWADDGIVRISIGAILLLMAGVTVWRRRAARREAEDEENEENEKNEKNEKNEDNQENEDTEGGNPGRKETGEGEVSTRAGRIKARSYGSLGGFTTMVANAGGPVMSLYLLSAGFRKYGFLGTSSFFFLIVNVFKVPFSVGLGLMNGHSLLLDLALFLFVVPGALIGRWAVHRINQRLFEQLVIAATVLGALQLLLR